MGWGIWFTYDDLHQYELQKKNPIFRIETQIADAECDLNESSKYHELHDLLSTNSPKKEAFKLESLMQSGTSRGHLIRRTPSSAYHQLPNKIGNRAQITDVECDLIKSSNAIHSIMYFSRTSQETSHYNTTNIYWCRVGPQWVIKCDKLHHLLVTNSKKIKWHPSTNNWCSVGTQRVFECDSFHHLLITNPQKTKTFKHNLLMQSGTSTSDLIRRELQHLLLTNSNKKKNRSHSSTNRWCRVGTWTQRPT